MIGCIAILVSGGDCTVTPIAEEISAVLWIVCMALAA